MSQHAVVIGSGMGGLTAARLLQKRGYEVTVLEQHYRPGGLLHRFFRKEGAFDTGFHYCGGIAPGQPLGQALRHLGVMDKLEFHALDPDGFDILRFPDAEIRVPAGWEALMNDPDPDRVARATEAMLGMVKLDIAALEAAADGR